MVVPSWHRVAEKLEWISPLEHFEFVGLDQKVIRKLAKDEDRTEIIKKKHSQEDIEQTGNPWWRSWWNTHDLWEIAVDKAWSWKIVSTIRPWKGVNADDDS